MAQAADADDTDRLARTAAVVAQRGVNSDTAAHHRSGDSGGDVVGNLDDEVGGSTVVQGISTIRLAAVQVGAVVRSDHVVGAVLLQTGGAGLAVTLTALAGVVLGSDTNAVTDLDVSLGFGADPNGNSDDLVADTAGVLGRALSFKVSTWFNCTPECIETYPAAAESVQVRSADTGVSDLDVNVGFLPGLGLELLPHHVALDGLGVQAHPALKLVVGSGHFQYYSGMLVECSVDRIWRRV